MQRLKKLAGVLAMVFVVSFLFSGCADASIAERRQDTSSTLYTGYVGTSFPTSFMPWLSRDGIAPTVASMIYNTLFSYDTDSGTYAPLTAKSWCYVDLEGQPLTQDQTFQTANDNEAVENYYSTRKEDYMAVRIELYDNVYWSDGEKLTVEDVYYSFDLATDYALSNHAGALAWTADLKHESDGGKLVTQGMFTAKHPDLSGTYGILPGEEDTVMYLLVNKSFGAVTTLFNTILILPEHIWEPILSSECQLNSKNPQGELLKRYENPVGSGAWILEKDETNTQVITLVQNPNYHLKAQDGSALYKVDKIKILLYLDSNTAIFALRKGYIDILDSAVSSNYLNLLSGEKDIFVSNAPGNGISCLVFNVNPSKPYDTGMKMLLQDIEVRKAIALAVNQEELIANVLDGAGKTASAGLIPANDELLYEPQADILSGPVEERLIEANAILDERFPDKDESGYRLYNGERIHFQIVTAAANQDLVSYLQRQLQKIGIEVTLQAAGSTPETTYLYNSNFDMTVQSVILSMANADVMYKAHFVTTERSSNYGKIQNEELTDEINAMRKTLNQEARIAKIHHLQVLTAQQYYKIPLYSSNVLSVARTDRFTGYVVSDGQTVFNNETLKNLVQVTGE